MEETIAVMVRRSMQLAKRQMTWFRRDPRISWLDAGDPTLTERAEELLAGARA
jgi:tRNA dimethylallyltransferase